MCVCLSLSHTLSLYTDGDPWLELQRDGVCALSNVVSAEWLASAQAFVEAMSPCVRYGNYALVLYISTHTHTRKYILC